MLFQIKYKNKMDEIFTFVLDKLGTRIKTEILNYVDFNRIKTVNEIRIKSNGFVCLLTNIQNFRTDIFVSQNEIPIIIKNLCDNSIYAHINTIRLGYISIEKGVRAGICGRATIENGEIEGVNDITSINIRIPHLIEGASKFLLNQVVSDGFSKSYIVFSKPGVGKTTILRDLIANFSQNFKDIRYAVIDSKCEITASIPCNITGDVYLSYPKGLAIEMATKGMTPHYIICDEISSMNESLEILNSINSGVKLIATTHASNVDELLRKDILKPLFSSCAFDKAIGVYRNDCQKRYSFSIHNLI